MNTQLSSAATSAIELTVGAPAAVSMALTYVTSADAIGLAMHNAVNAQHAMQTVARSAVAVACAQIVSTTVATAGG